MRENPQLHRGCSTANTSVRGLKGFDSRAQEPHRDAGSSAQIFDSHDLADCGETHAGLGQLQLEIHYALNVVPAFYLKEEAVRADVPCEGPCAVSQLQWQGESLSGVGTLLDEHAASVMCVTKIVVGRMWSFP
jgi:hypothetical protein